MILLKQVIMTAALSCQLYSGCHGGQCVVPEDALASIELAYNTKSLPWAWHTGPVRLATTAPSWTDRLVPWPKKKAAQIAKPEPEPEEHYTATDPTMANAPAWLKTRWKSKPRVRR